MAREYILVLRPLSTVGRNLGIVVREYILVLRPVSTVGKNLGVGVRDTYQCSGLSVQFGET